jgi:hypothetical protein
MYGALYVVEDLDAYEANPEAYLAAAKLPIKDDLLKDRRPRTEWRFEDLATDLGHLEGGRSFANAKQMFTVASCVACHKLDGTGNQFGPDLAQLDVKLQPADTSGCSIRRPRSKSSRRRFSAQWGRRSRAWSWKLPQCQARRTRWPGGRHRDQSGDIRRKINRRSCPGLLDKLLPKFSIWSPSFMPGKKDHALSGGWRQSRRT